MGVNGEYHPFSVIVQKEGGGKEGLIAAQNLIEACYKLHAKGLTHKGKPYVVKNSFTRRPEYLYAKRVFSESFEQRWPNNFEEAMAHPEEMGETADIDGVPIEIEDYLEPPSPAKQPTPANQPTPQKPVDPTTPPSTPQTKPSTGGGRATRGRLVTSCRRRSPMTPARSRRSRSQAGGARRRCWGRGPLG